MDWGEVAQYVFTILGYGIIFQTLLWIIGHEIVKKNKYKFNCPMCDFRFSTNDRTVLVMTHAAHKHYGIKLMEDGERTP